MGKYFEIGIYRTKTEANVGTLWRTAYQLGASGIFTIGRRYKSQCSDTVKAHTGIPLRHYDTFADFLANRPHGAVLVGVEMGGRPLSTFSHPRNAIYLLGAEDNGLPAEILAQCNEVISLESVRVASFNVAMAGGIVMYHRQFG